MVFVTTIPSGRVITGPHPSFINFSISSFPTFLEKLSLSILRKNLVYVRYLDHVLFRYTSPFRHSPVEREAVGWLVKETLEALWIVGDRSTQPLEQQTGSDSGLVILKSDVLEMKRLDQRTCIKYCSASSGSCRVCASGKGSEKLGRSGEKQRCR